MTSEKDQGIEDVSIDRNPFEFIGKSPKDRTRLLVYVI